MSGVNLTGLLLTVVGYSSDSQGYTWVGPSWTDWPADPSIRC